MRQKAKPTTVVTTLAASDASVQCNIQGSAIASVSEADTGMTSFLKDRYEQVKQENANLKS